MNEHKNFIIYMGCSPGLGVDAFTKMIREIGALFESAYDQKEFFVELPDILDNLEASDTNIEIIQSEQPQRVRILREANLVTDSTGVIFVHTNAKGLEYQGWEEKVELYKEIFEKFL